MNYNARIEVSADARKVEQAIDRIEQRLNRLRDRAAQISLGGISGSKLEQQKLLPPASQLTRFERTTKAIADSAKRASTALKGLAVAGGALAGADAINALGKSLEKASVSIDLFGVSASAPVPALNQLGANLREATAGIEPFVQALQSAGGSGLTTAAGIATATTAFIAFEPAITAALDKLKIAERAFKLLSPAIKDTEVNFDGYIKKIRRATDVVSNLRESQRIIRQELDNVNSSTEEAADTAGAYVRVTERLNDELRAQADLLRQARGFTVKNLATGEVRTLTELEATKGRRSIATRQTAAEFRARQAQEQEELALKIAGEEIALKKSLEKLENESITRANTRLDLQAQLTQELQKTVDAAKFRAGQPAQQRLLPAFTERGLKTLDDSVRLNESQLRIEAALNGQRARGVRFLEKQTQEERRQLDLGITGTRSNLLRPGAANLAEQQAQALAASRATERLAITQKLQQTTSGVRTQLNLQLAIATKLQPAIAAITAEFERQLSIQKQGALLAGKFSPIGGAENIPGSPEFIKAQARRRKEAIGSGIIGGAFPLLFGQGVGAAAGGGLGGAAGGLVGGQFGFGLSLVGTALGTAVDTLIGNISKVADSLGDPTKALEALEEAGIKVDDSLKANVDSLLDAGQAYEAQQLVLQEITDTLGPQAVSQLAAYDQETKKLEQSYQDAYTALVRELLPAMVGFVAGINQIAGAFGNMPDWVKGLIGGVAKYGPLRGGAAAFSTLQATGRDVSEGVTPVGAKASPEALEAKRKKALEGIQTDAQLDVIEKQNAALEAGNSLLNEGAYIAARQVIFAQTRLAVAQAEGDTNKIKVALAREALELDRLRLRQVEELGRTEKDAAREAERAARLAEQAAQKELKIRTALISEDLKQTDIAHKINALELGKAVTIDDQLAGLDKRKAQERTQIALSTEDVRLQEEKLRTLDLQYYFTKKQLEADKAALEVQRQQQSLRGNQEVAGLRTQLEQELGGLQLGTNAFDDLATEQANRYANALREINNQLALQKIELANEQDVDRQEQIRKSNEYLEKKKALYEDLLPAIAAAEQEQLIYNEALAHIQGPVNSLVSGFREVIAGTKSVEQAFADFLTTIADQLAQTATTMIAEYIAIGIARAFSLGKSPAVGTQASDFSLTGFGNPGSGAGSGISGFLAGASGIPGMANGGPVNANQPYIVGERGPELFVPFQQGSITSNEAMQQASMAQLPFTRNAESIAQAQHTAQAMQSAGPINVKYESTMINGVEYVTREQAERIGSQSAERGRALTLQALQNSVRTRSKVGL